MEGGRGLGNALDHRTNRPLDYSLLDLPPPLSYHAHAMPHATKIDIAAQLLEFTLGNQQSRLFEAANQKQTRVEPVHIGGREYPRFINEFWTAQQRQSSSLHQIAYRACFKPQLPRFFIERLTGDGDLVYDPFAGRGTTIVEAALLGRQVIGNDINPLSRILTLPRLRIPNMTELKVRLNSIPTDGDAASDLDLSMFYHADTLKEILSLRNYLRTRKENGEEDGLDAWIRMVATNRLTGHSPGFFSVYTLPPNQAVSAPSQRKINRKRNQKPDYRDTRFIIQKKSSQLVNGLTLDQIRNLEQAATRAQFFSLDARATPAIADRTVHLVVTSPPFLDVVQYAQDNWLRCWFNGIDTNAISGRITAAKTIDAWTQVMRQVFAELHRVTRAGGWVAFEVGEIRGRSIALDEYVVPLGIDAGFSCEGILVNEQSFTKTANIWGVDNNSKGTNTNRVVMFYKK
jgi:DNA modification methylase